MRRCWGSGLLIAALTLLGRPAAAQGDGWHSLSERGGCLGGRRCARSLELRLDERPVQAIRFEAHDDVGVRGGGRLRVWIDDDAVERGLELRHERRSYTLDGRGLRGRRLVFEPLGNEAVVVERV